MPSRRSFLRAATGAAVALPTFARDAFALLDRAAPLAAGRSPRALADDEAYWSHIQRAFDLDRTMINLNNGGVSPAPTHVLDQMIRDLRFSNELPVDHMWRILQPRMEATRRDLARDFGCAPEEMAVVRNASEAMETMILGCDLRRGDEVVVTNQNYGRMLTTWDQRARREGIVVKAVSVPVPPRDDRQVVDAFFSAVTPRTRVIEVTHITNLTGQVFPVRAIVERARPLGIQVFVDGAHAYAHFPFTRDDLGCDYYGTSLHKWLFAPIGAGFLYVRRERIPQLWPLMAAPKEMDADIRKYEEIGTHPQANFNAVSVALAFHRGIGADRKVARLRWLRDHWATALLAEDARVKVLTPLGPEAGGAIALVHVDGLDPAKLAGWLYDRHRIVVTPIVHAEFSGLRITPSVYTTRDELAVFVDAMRMAMRRGIA